MGQGKAVHVPASIEPRLPSCLNEEFDYVFKLLLVGDSGVGKSNLLHRFSDDRFYDRHLATIGVDFKIRTVNVSGKVAKLQVWDTAGQERFRTITSSYYRGAHGIIVVYDITDRESFENVPGWFRECDRYANDYCHRMLIGNKSDKTSERQVEYCAGLDAAAGLGVTFSETSAKHATNVNEAFATIAAEIAVKVADPDSAMPSGWKPKPKPCTGSPLKLVPGGPAGRLGCC